MYSSLKENKTKTKFIDTITIYNSLVNKDDNSVLPDSKSLKSEPKTYFQSIKKYSIEDEYSLVIKTNNKHYNQYVNSYRIKRDKFAYIKITSIILIVLIFLFTKI